MVQRYLAAISGELREERVWCHYLQFWNAREAALVEGEQWQGVFKANGGNQHVFDSNVFIAANQDVVQLCRAPRGIVVKRQDGQHTEQRIFANLLFRACHAEQQFLNGNGRDKARATINGLLDGVCAGVNAL